MNRLLALCIFWMVLFADASAQQVFIPNGKITFEKKINVQRSFADIDIPEEALERMKKYNVTSWELYFNQTSSLYKAKKKEANAAVGEMFMFSSGENTKDRKSVV